MTASTDGEKIVELQTNMHNVSDKVNNIENSVNALHGKFDSFKDDINKNFVPMGTFDEYRKTQVEKNKNRYLEIVIAVLITSIVGGLVAFFLREAGT